MFWTDSLGIHYLLYRQNQLPCLFSVVELSVATYAIVPRYNLDYNKEDISWMPTVYLSNATLLSIFTICSLLIDVINKSETRRGLLAF